ncbi:hypothetical protein F9278_14010 [Streptomyces phaeolivaceus]|uniref:Uncharacterized protein n=1 Tax=Streptomyces phaeolivaceus TaxID=2653200 RepID=A0A5P8K2D5_9ACTN|nr:hypothetical protein F9278_14010 [Streptomyces phaeolivaceus]
MWRGIHRRTCDSGVRLAHDPQGSIDRLCRRVFVRFRPGNEKSPRTGGDAALMPTTPFIDGRD